jgi:hypothetical protein
VTDGGWGLWYPTLSAKGAERMGHPDTRNSQDYPELNTEGSGNSEAALPLFRLAQLGDYGEVFERGGVALDFAVGG